MKYMISFYFTEIFVVILRIYYPIIFRLHQKNLALEDFSYSNQEIMEEIYSAMNSTDFLGVSVSVIMSIIYIV